MSRLAGLLAVALAAAGCAGDDSNAPGLDAGGDATALDGAVDGGAAYDGETCDLRIRTSAAACDQCLGVSCCDLANACDDPVDGGDDGSADTCVDLMQCLFGCVIDAGPDADPGGIAACDTACNGARPSGAAKYQALRACMAAHCDGPLPDGGAGPCATAIASF